MKPDDLVEHPEGGRYREVFRSKQVVTANGLERAALTHIYFSLDQGEFSRFHRVKSDEVWNLYQGSGLRLHIWDGTTNSPISVELSKEVNSFCHVVPAGAWQAAEPISEAVLVGCSVAPGFEFHDFEMLERNSSEYKLLKEIAPKLHQFVDSR